jgi:hypothetical protein
MVRTDKLEGKDYLVCPVVMMVEGVHCGSGGPIFYSAEELSKFPSTWDAKPVVINHPQENGEAVSASSPNVANSTKVGELYNTKFENGKLKSEAWIDPEKLKEVSIQTFNMLSNDQLLEVSIGVFFDLDETEGTWNNESYSAIAKNLRSDHLAILPFDVGACSVADGSGMPRINTAEEQMKYHSHCNITVNDESFFDIVKGIYDALGSNNAYVEDVFEDYFVYSIDGKPNEYYKCSYKLVDSGSIELGEEVYPVRRKISYEPKETTNMAKDKTVTNEEVKEEEIVVAAKEPEVKIEPVTLETYVANAPDEIKQILSDALAYLKSEKDALISTVTENSDVFTKDELNVKTFSEVKKLAVFCKPKTEETVNTNFGGKVATVISNGTKTVEPLPNLWK